MDVMKYMEFEIHAVPWQLAETGQWDINFEIVRHTGDQVKFRNFYAADTYPTREEAVQHCFNAGRQIIEGRVPNCSVADL